MQYWPDSIGRTQTYGPLNVCLTEEVEFADYVVRTIELKVLQVSFGVRVMGITDISNVYRILSWVTVCTW